jgi:hypothetical protein
MEWSQIDQLLEEDDYKPVPKNRVLPGDVVIYWASANPLLGLGRRIDHSGMVLAVLPLGDMRILSKWGHGDEWVHTLADCPYSAADVTFHRINDDPRNTIG